MGKNKIIYGGNVLIDLTADTVSADKLLSGITAHDKSGEIIEGTCTYDSDTQDATVAVAEMLIGKTAYARGSKLTGTMPNNGAVTGSIETKDGTFSIPLGFHDGSGSVSISLAEQAKLISANIKSGIEILGVIGSYSGEAVTAQSKDNIIPKTTSQTILPDPEFDYLSQVVIAAIPYVESANSAGGITVTIG